MPHDLPTKRLRDGEPVDPDFFNENFQAVAGKLAGRLGEQDIDAATLKAREAGGTSAFVAPEAYYDAHHLVYASSPAWDRNPGVDIYALRDGDAAEDDPAEVRDTVSWGSLTEVGGTATTSLTITTGDDTLVIFAQAQHIAWRGFDSTALPDTPPPNVPVRLQYALEVDGVILDDTVTGAFFIPDPPPQQWYRATPSGDDFDYRHIQRIQDTVGINNAVHANRLIRSVPVLAGSHTVELKARRIPSNDYKVDDDGTGMEVQVFNRRLFVLRIKGKSAYSGGVPDVTVDAVEDGQTVTLNNIFTNSLAALRAVANDIEPKHIARGALRNEHLPSVVYGANVAVITPSSSVGPWTSLYPGYDTTTAAWERIDDGAGNELVVTGPTAGEWRLDTYPGLFVVLANVQVPKVSWVAGYADPSDLRAIGCFAIAITNSAGTRTVIGETEAYVNGHNPDPYAAAPAIMAPSEDDVTLMWVIDSTSLSAANQRIVSVEVVVSQWDGRTGGAANVEVRTQRGSLCAFALKGVST